MQLRQTGLLTWAPGRQMGGLDGDTKLKVLPGSVVAAPAAVDQSVSAQLLAKSYAKAHHRKRVVQGYVSWRHQLNLRDL